MVLEDEVGGMRLVQHPQGPSTRPLRDSPASLAPLEKPEDCPLYADGYPYLLLSKASMDDLNSRLEEEGKEEVGEDRFRPNIFIDGDFPGFAEDSWSHIKIGDAVFRNVKLCTRCVFITVTKKIIMNSIMIKIIKWTLTKVIMNSMLFKTIRLILKPA